MAKAKKADKVKVGKYEVLTCPYEHGKREKEQSFSIAAVSTQLFVRCNICLADGPSAKTGAWAVRKYNKRVN